MRLTGIIEYSMGNFLCIRGFAPLIDLNKISIPAPDIQRNLIAGHTGEMQQFLSSGSFTFFPEVILCTNLVGDGASEEKINSLCESVRQQKTIKNTKISEFTISTRVYDRKKQNDDMAFDRVQAVFLDFDMVRDGLPKILRIDGNHRLSAVDETSSYKDLVTPFCLLLFGNSQDTDKFSRALFHNINSKQIPLMVEQNLKVIIKGDIAFSDDTLVTDPSFGLEYLLARKTLQIIRLQDYPFIQTLIRNNECTYFVEIYQLLMRDGLLTKSEDAVGILTSKLSEINDALRESTTHIPLENIAVIGALSYYKLSDNKDKYHRFLVWMNQNSIAEIDNLHMQDLIKIFDKVYDNLPKTVFMSMWFNEKTKDTYQTVTDVRDILKREDNVDLKIIKVDEHSDGCSGEIYSRIIQGIEQSALVIADLSYGNKNVHHEIGYAQGKNKKILLLYHERDGVDSKTEIGSNISMHDQLRFKNQTELRPELLKRIRDYLGIAKE